MMRKPALYLPVACLALILTGAAPLSTEERLEQARNLGKAFYENPTTANEAVAEFKKALDLAPNSNREKLNYALALLRAGKAEAAVALLKEVQSRDPKLPHTWFNLGIYYRKNGEPEPALAQFDGMLRLTPQEPVAHYQRGALLRQLGRNNEAAAEFEQAAKLNPLLAAAHFQLYNLYRPAGRAAEATRQLQTFQMLKKQQEGAAVPEDVDWCNYAEIYDPQRAVTAAAAEPRPVYDDTPLPGAVDAKTAGLLAIDATGKGQVDLLVWSMRGAALYRQGVNFAADSGLADLKDLVDIAPGDFDNDGLMDLCVLTTAGPRVYRNTGGKFARFEANLPERRFDRAVWIDYDHDYDLDLVLLGSESALMRNQGSAGFADRTADFPFVNGRVTSAYRLRVEPDSKAFDLAVFYTGHAPVIYRDRLGGHYQAASFDGKPRDLTQLDADFDGDGKPDRVRIAADGGVHFMRNRTQSNRHWIRVQLAGVKSLKLGQDAEIEIKAGRLYRKQFYEGVPLLFDLGDYTEADVVRITWMNGLIQNETKQAANKAYRYEEAQRLSGSCPMVWTWNGHEFQFITDVLGVAPLGASDGEGSYFPVDHDEYVSIPGQALAPVEGRYQVRITEELSEVSYLDQVQLYAVDHPAATEIYTNEKFKSPPYPDFRLFGVKRGIHPRAARDDRGRNVLPLILATDRRYPAEFKRSESGIAERHTLELDFGAAAPAGRAVLLLRGWVDWPDGSTFRAASQASRQGLVMPSLEMQDRSGKWQTVNADMGMPAGKPKTIAVPLQFISESRKVRIVTNLCVYWDESFLSEDVSNPVITERMAAIESADLHFRGFSESRIDAQRKQPDTYTYAHVSPVSFWNPTPGLYTRYGNVRELLDAVDDRLVIMGSGDELTLRFAATAFPPVPAGWTRDYLLKVDGWAKDRDANTAFPATVEPLPFHAMSVYPYPGNEHFPDDASHREYREKYNTRPALRLIRPLTD
jgi:tetratricopeptide (TPR) repeat protein